MIDGSNHLSCSTDNWRDDPPTTFHEYATLLQLFMVCKIKKLCGHFALLRSVLCMKVIDLRQLFKSISISISIPLNFHLNSAHVLRIRSWKVAVQIQQIRISWNQVKKKNATPNLRKTRFDKFSKHEETGVK